MEEPGKDSCKKCILSSVNLESFLSRAVSRCVFREKCLPPYEGVITGERGGSVLLTDWHNILGEE